MPKKTLEIIIKIGIFLALMSFFIIANPLYFPYVSGKQLYFNILIEILAVGWSYLLMKYPSSSPRASWLTYSLIAWLGVLLVSAVFGVDFNLSFWGDTERMLGWFSLAHFFVFYLITITVFKSKKDWQLLLNAVVLAAVVIAIYAWLTADGAKFQGNVNLTSNISTLGNATYVAGVMLFALYFIVYLWRATRRWLLKVWYLVAAGWIFWAFFYANVSGSQAALLVSILLAMMFAAILSQNKKIKTWLLSAVGLLLILSAVALWQQRAPIFDNNPVGRMVREFSDSNVSLNARLFAWRAGWQGFLERPLLGWGYGNFAHPFDKFFRAGLYRWTPNEEYYDRAHNMVVEMLATAGLLGFITYLGIFGAVGFSIWRLVKDNKIKPMTAAVVVGLFSAYFIHNLAVFDSLANFVCLMVALAFVYWLANQSITESAIGRPLDKHWLYSLLVAVIMLSAGLIYYANIRPAQMLMKTVRTAEYWYEGDINNFLSSYEETFALHTPLDRDSRTMLVNLVISTPNRLTKASDYKINRFLESLLANSRRNLHYTNQDYFLLVRHAALLELIGLARNDQNMLNEALATTDQAIAIGGEHVAAFLYKANILLSLKRYSEAIVVLRQVMAFQPDYQRIACRLADLELRYGTGADETAQWSNFDDCLDKGKVGDLGRGEELMQAVKHYELSGDKMRLEKLKQQLIP